MEGREEPWKYHVFEAVDMKGMKAFSFMSVNTKKPVVLL